MNCSTKKFQILDIKCETYDIQRQHCYQHLNYYPFVCTYKPNESSHRFCGQKFFTFKSCELHLKFEHNFNLDENKDNCLLLTKYFDFNSIEKIEDLINTRLNSKFVSIFAMNSGM